MYPELVATTPRKYPLDYWSYSDEEREEYIDEYVVPEIRSIVQDLGVSMSSLNQLLETRVTSLSDRNRFIRTLHDINRAHIAAEELPVNQQSYSEILEAMNHDEKTADFIALLVRQGANIRAMRRFQKLEHVIDLYRLTEPVSYQPDVEPFDADLCRMAWGQDAHVQLDGMTLADFLAKNIKNSEEREEMMRFVIDGLMFSRGVSPVLIEQIQKENDKYPNTHYAELAGHNMYNFGSLINVLGGANIDTLKMIQAQLHGIRPKSSLDNPDYVCECLDEVITAADVIQSVYKRIVEAVKNPKDHPEDFRLARRVLEPRLFSNDGERTTLIGFLTGFYDDQAIALYRDAYSMAHAGVETNFYNMVADSVERYMVDAFPDILTQSDLVDIVPVERFDDEEPSAINWEYLTNRISKIGAEGEYIFFKELPFTSMPDAEATTPTHIGFLLDGSSPDKCIAFLIYPSKEDPEQNKTVMVHLNLSDKEIDWNVLYDPNDKRYVGARNVFLEYIEQALAGKDTEGPVAQIEAAPVKPRKAQEQKIIGSVERLPASPMSVQEHGLRIKKPVLVSTDEAVALRELPFGDPFDSSQRLAIWKAIMASNEETNPNIIPVRGRPREFRLAIKGGIPNLDSGVRVFLEKEKEGYRITRIVKRPNAYK